MGADLLHNRHLMGDNDDGDAQALVDVLDQPQDGAGGGGVQRAGGLVAQKHLGIGGQGPGDGDALLLAAGELGRIGIGLVGQPHDLQQLQGPAFGLGRASSGDLQGEADIFQAGALHQQIKLLEDHADTAALLPQLSGAEGGHIRPVDDHLPGAGPFQQVDAPHQRGLARAGHTHHAENVSVRNGQVDVLQGGKRSVRRGEGL